MPLWYGGEGGSERPKNSWRVHSRCVASIHAGTEGLGGSNALGVSIVHGVFRFVWHRHVAIEGGHVHPPVRHERAVRVLWGFHFHFSFFRLSLEFHSAILEPGFDLHVRELQFLC